ncbi:NUDIX domain-containing protein [Patescibacteria group bacterium]|nr:NUDIX domain-containing protein [Patescibacteria group bacterium]
MDQQNKKVGVGFGVMLLKDKKILLGKRHDDPEKASSALHGEGTWTMPGGKLHFGETFEQGAEREVLEETGMQVNKMEVISLSNNIVSDAHFITVGFLCEDFSGEPEIKEPDEITEWRWFELSSLPKPIFQPSQEVLNNYLSNKFYSV